MDLQEKSLGGVVGELHDSQNDRTVVVGRAAVPGLAGGSGSGEPSEFELKAVSSLLS